MPRRAIVLFLSIVFAAASCKAKPNDKCSGAGVCQDAHTALVCNSMFRYEAASCKGPDGCSESPFRCDYRGNTAGDRCFEGAEGHPQQCTPDKKARVSCRDGKVEREECDGPKGCTPRTEATMSCDRALKVGTPCSVDGDWCSDDRTDWLQCEQNKMVAIAKCRGPKGCRASSPSFETTIECDVSVAERGDPCVGKVTGCSSDGTAVLECKDRRFEATACPPGKRCSMRDQEARCD